MISSHVDFQISSLNFKINPIQLQNPIFLQFLFNLSYFLDFFDHLFNQLIYI